VGVTSSVLWLVKSEDASVWFCGVGGLGGSAPPRRHTFHVRRTDTQQQNSQPIIWQFIRDLGFRGGESRRCVVVVVVVASDKVVVVGCLAFEPRILDLVRYQRAQRRSPTLNQPEKQDLRRLPWIQMRKNNTWSGKRVYRSDDSFHGGRRLFFSTRLFLGMFEGENPER